MNEAQRAFLLALYPAISLGVALFRTYPAMYRALCQVRAEIERACPDLPQSPTRRNAA